MSASHRHQNNFRAMEQERQAGEALGEAAHRLASLATVPVIHDEILELRQRAAEFETSAMERQAELDDRLEELHELRLAAMNDDGRRLLHTETLELRALESLLGVDA